MNAARVGQNHVTACHEVVEIQHVERFDDVYSLIVAEDRVRSLAHDGVHMYRINRLDVGVLVHYAADRAEHMLHRFAEVLAAVGGDEDQPTALRPVEFGVMIVVAHGSFKRVDGGVAGDVDRAFVLALADKVLLRQFGRREVILTYDADRLPVEFFGVRAVNVVCTQSRLDVTDRNLEIEARERGYECCRGVAVNENDVRSDFFKNWLDAIQDVRRDVEQRLLVFHNRQVEVWHDAERFKYLIEHLTVLTGHADNGFYFTVSLQFVDERTHLYRFGACAEDEHDFFH